MPHSVFQMISMISCPSLSGNHGTSHCLQIYEWYKQVCIHSLWGYCCVYIYATYATYSKVQKTLRLSMCGIIIASAKYHTFIFNCVEWGHPIPWQNKTFLCLKTRISALLLYFDYACAYSDYLIVVRITFLYVINNSSHAIKNCPGPSTRWYFLWDIASKLLLYRSIMCNKLVNIHSFIVPQTTNSTFSVPQNPLIISIWYFMCMLWL